MQDYVSIIVFIGLIIGLLVGYFFRKFLATRFLEGAEIKIKEAEEKAHRQSQEIILQAKGEALKLMEEVKKEENNRRVDLKSLENRLEERRSLFDKKLLEFEEEKGKLVFKAKKIEEIKEKTVIKKPKNHKDGWRQTISKDCFKSCLIIAKKVLIFN